MIFLGINCNKIYYISIYLQCLSDPTHVLRDYLNKEGLVTVNVTPKEKKSYYKEFDQGIVQPGVICITPDRTVIYSWASQPNEVGLEFILTLVIVLVLEISPILVKAILVPFYLHI